MPHEPPPEIIPPVGRGGLANVLRRGSTGTGRQTRAQSGVEGDCGTGRPPASISTGIPDSQGGVLGPGCAAFVTVVAFVSVFAVISAMPAEIYAGFLFFALVEYFRRKEQSS